MRSLSIWFSAFFIVLIVLGLMSVGATERVLTSPSTVPVATATKPPLPKAGDCVTPRQEALLFLSRRGEKVILSGYVSVRPGIEFWVQDDGRGGPFIHGGWLEITAIMDGESVEGHLPLDEVEICP